MKASRYYELLSKIDTDISADERIKKELRYYQNNDENIQNFRFDPMTDKRSNTYNSRGSGSLQRIMPKVSILKQALPSLAFLLIIAILIYGFVMRLYKDNKNINSELIPSSETASDTVESRTDATTASDTVESLTYVTTDVIEVNDENNVDTDDETTDPPNDTHYVVTANNAEAVNICTAYYKNVTYREDLKIYLIYNDASMVKSLFVESLGTINKANYTVDGNIITVRKEYLDTLPDGLYTLNINMDKGNPAVTQLTVYPKEAESEYGFYRLSSYYWDYYISDPRDFTFLVFNRRDARITGLRNGSVDIDPKYYYLDENGYIATLYKNYMADMEEGVRFNLTVEFSDGMEKDIGIKIRYKEMNKPFLNSAYNIFNKSKPEDVTIKIVWNDAEYITSIDPETHFSASLSNKDYTLDYDTLTIKKEFLSSLDAGEYIWYLMFDTETGSEIKIRVND